MRQFDVYRNPSAAAHAPFLVVLQSHYLEGVGSVVVAPAVRDARRLMSEVEVPFEFDGEALAITVAELAAVDRSYLTQAVGSAAQHEDALRRALDRLFTGF